MCIFSFFCVSVSQSVIDQVWLAIPACQYDAVFNLQCEQIQSFDHPDCMYACMEFWFGVHWSSKAVVCITVLSCWSRMCQAKRHNYEVCVKSQHGASHFLDHTLLTAGIKNVWIKNCLCVCLSIHPAILNTIIFQCFHIFCVWVSVCEWQSGVGASGEDNLHSLPMCWRRGKLEHVRRVAGEGQERHC